MMQQQQQQQQQGAGPAAGPGSGSGSGAGKAGVGPGAAGGPGAADHLPLSSEQEMLSDAGRPGPLRLSFVLRLSEATASQWETVLWGRRLYIQVPTCLPPEGSKQGFIRLLEYAEEVLGCIQIVICLSKDRADRALLVRTFMFLGFTALPPGHPLAPRQADAAQLFMLYDVQ